MSSESLIADFIKFFSENVKFDTIVKSGAEVRFTLKESNTAWQSTIVSSIFSDTDIVGDKITLNLGKCKLENCYFFLDTKDYMVSFDKYSTVYLEADIVILNWLNRSVWKFKNEDFSNEKALFFNFPVYTELFDFLKKNNLFATFYSAVKNEIIILTRDNGAFHIGNKKLEEKVSLLPNLLPLVEVLEKSFENKEFIQFFKENITVFGIGNSDSEERFFEIVKNLKPIILLTERDYENYVRNFNFENIKTKFKEERNKYFEGLEKNIELVNRQVLSIPLTFAATAFASYQVKDKPLIVVLILIAFILYSIIAFKMLGISRFNIQCISEDVNKEEREIKDNFSKNYAHFEKDFEKINLKIQKIKSLILLISGVLKSMLVLFVLFSIFQYFNNEKSVKKTISIPIENIRYISIDTGEVKGDTLKQIPAQVKKKEENAVKQKK